jgi:hypothetical protein
MTIEQAVAAIAVQVWVAASVVKSGSTFERAVCLAFATAWIVVG